MPTLPCAPEEISAAWLTDVLGVTIDAVRVADAHAGTTGRAVVEISHGSDELPDRLFVKLPPTDEMQRHFVVSTGMGRNEVLFYQHLGAEVPVRVPHAYYASANPEGTEYIMLLEHLEDVGCTFRNSSTRYSKAYLQEVLEVFARLHGQYWNTPRFDTDLDWLKPPVQHEIAVPLVEESLKLHGSRMPAVFTEMATLYLEQSNAIHQLWQRGTPTVIHGDVHDANFFYDRDQPGLLDWAIASRGPAMRDVGYFLAGTLEPEHQAPWGRELVEFYLSELARSCSEPPDIGTLWQQYQWHAAYVWVGSAVTLAMGEEWQPVNYVLAGLERIHAAMEALDSVAAIRNAL